MLADRISRTEENLKGRVDESPKDIDKRGSLIKMGTMTRTGGSNRERKLNALGIVAGIEDSASS